MTQPESPSGFDAYHPEEVARRVESSGIAKVRRPFLQTAMLGVFAGAFIAFGALFYTLTITGSTLGIGPTRLLGGIAFSLGLILVVIGGAELFTGNNLIIMAWAERHIRTTDMLRNWLIVFLANFVGALGIAALVVASGTLRIADGAVGETAAAMALTKLQLPLWEAFFRGVLCNILVCLAIWLGFAARSVAGKILAIVFPITAFVGLGFEHSVANMYVVPIAMLAGLVPPEIGLFAKNLAMVTLGNIVGGAGLVALPYWLIYLRPRSL